MKQAASDVFQCVPNQLECGEGSNVEECSPGQNTCRAGACSCSSSLAGGYNSCEVEGRWCRGTTCGNPRQYEECEIGNTEATCDTGLTCTGFLFGDGDGLCLKPCANTNQCDVGQFCYGGQFCLPITGRFFSALACEQSVPASDGGWEMAEEIDGGTTLVRRTVGAGNSCLRKTVTNTGGSSGYTDEYPGLGTGNCGYVTYRMWNRNFVSEACLEPGLVEENEPCNLDLDRTKAATQCAQGLTCVPTRGGDDGVCLRACNAQPPEFGFTPEPACNAEEVCVNTLRYSDPNNNSVLGACMKRCSVFSADAGTCDDLVAVDGGATISAVSCVPTQANGELSLSLDGTGVCVPQRPTISAPGEACDETDPFRGAACDDGQLCTSAGNVNQPPRCVEVCDLACAPLNGTPPADCATRPHALCSGEKTCTRVSSTTGAQVGFCL